MISKEEGKINEIPEFDKKNQQEMEPPLQSVKNRFFCTIVPDRHGITAKCFFREKEHCVL